MLVPEHLHFTCIALMYLVVKTGELGGVSVMLSTIQINSNKQTNKNPGELEGHPGFEKLQFKVYSALNIPKP